MSSKLFATAALLLPARLGAASAAHAGAMVVVADTRNLTGLEAWSATLYNQSHLLFALLTVVLIPLTGIALGSLAGFLMGRIGIDLRSRVLREG